MFQSSTNLRELVQSLAKVTLLLKHSVKLRHILCGDEPACREMVCVLFVVQTAQQTTHTPFPRKLISTIFICLFAYLFVFCIIFIRFHYSKKTHLSITDILPRLHTLYNDVILPNVLTEV